MYRLYGSVQCTVVVVIGVQALVEMYKVVLVVTCTVNGYGL